MKSYKAQIFFTATMDRNHSYFGPQPSLPNPEALLKIVRIWFVCSAVGIDGCSAQTHGQFTGQ